MYEAYFQLQKRPFSTTPDPNCVFAPEPIQELIDELILRTESGQGIAVLTAPAGTGKTLLCRRILVEFAGRRTPIFLANANFPTRRALLQSILFELGRRFSGLEEQELRLAVFAALRELTLAGRGVVLIVDEAHLLNERLLEEVRLLACLAEGEEPLARVILAGQMALEERLVDRALEALNQRIVCQVYLEPLTRQQSIDYVKFRIKWAGGDSSRIFTPKALDQIAAACNGLPRCLNQLCDHVLLLTYVQEQPQVTEEAVEEALCDLRQLPLRWNTPVAADSALDELDDPSALNGEDGGDEIEYAPAAKMAGPARSVVAETVSFEIGDATLALDPMTISTDDLRTLEQPSVSSPRPQRDAPPMKTGSHRERQRAGLVSLTSAAPPATRNFVEEAIDDRYAALDLTPRRFLRTFEDAAVPESWDSSRQAPAPSAPRPPTSPVWSQAGDVAPGQAIDDLRPERLIDDMLPMIAEARWADTDSDGQSSEYSSCRSVDFEPHLADDVGIMPSSIEDQIGSSIRDACLEVQTAIGQWRERADVVNTIDSSHSMLANDAEIIHPIPIAEYDVIEPDYAADLTDEFDATRATASAGSLSAGRYIPQPKYRHVFSTLRRRLGRGLRPSQ